MRRSFVLAAAGLLALTSGGPADEVIPRDQRYGRQRITTIVIVPGKAPAAVPGLPPEGVPAPKTPAGKDGKPPKIVVPPKVAKLAEALLKELKASGMDTVTLKCRTWICGRYFLDHLGRRWGLCYGPAVSIKPATVTGWLIPTDVGALFVTATGSVFRELPAALPVLKPALDLPAVESP